MEGAEGLIEHLNGQLLNGECYVDLPYRLFQLKPQPPDLPKSFRCCIKDCPGADAEPDAALDEQ